MYFDAFIVIALIVFAVCWFRKFSKLVYSLAIIDIFLRLLDYIANHMGIKNFANWANSIFPDNIVSIINKYTNGIFCTILIWIYIVIMVFFLYYTIRAFIKKR